MPRENGHFADGIFKRIFFAVQATSHYLNQWWLVYRRIYASLDLDEFTLIMRILTYCCLGNMNHSKNRLQKMHHNFIDNGSCMNRWMRVVQWYKINKPLLTLQVQVWHVLWSGIQVSPLFRITPKTRQLWPISMAAKPLMCPWSCNMKLFCFFVRGASLARVFFFFQHVLGTVIWKKE